MNIYEALKPTKAYSLTQRGQAAVTESLRLMMMNDATCAEYELMQAAVYRVAGMRKGLMMMPGR